MATHIAESSPMGHRVLAVHFDPQCNLTDLLNEATVIGDVNMEEYKIAADVGKRSMSSCRRIRGRGG